MALQGIDISSWQTGIDLTAVPADFVIMKATQGTYYISPDCDRQYQQARNMGRLRGVYHYAGGGDPISEADYFLAQIDGYIHDALLVLDWEGEDNPQFHSGNDVYWCKTWLDHVYERTGVRPLLYISQSEMYRFSDIGNYGFWIAQYADMNPTGYQDSPWNEDAYSCAIRQYSSSGTLPGYSGYLDINKFYGDAGAWNAYANPTGEELPPAPAPAPTPSGNAPEGTTLDLAYRVMNGEFGGGDERRNALGNRYDEVQSFINHIYDAYTDTLVEEVYAGKYGNGDTRKVVLGERYNEVQSAINGAVESKEVYYTVEYGDTLSGIAAAYNTTYQSIAALNGLSNPNLIYAGQVLRIF